MLQEEEDDDFQNLLKLLANDEVENNESSFEADQGDFPHCTSYSYSRCLARFILLTTYSFINLHEYEVLFYCILNFITCDGNNKANLLLLIISINDRSQIWPNDVCNRVINDFYARTQNMTLFHNERDTHIEVMNSSGVIINKVTKVSNEIILPILNDVLKTSNYVSIGLYFIRSKNNNFTTLKTKHSIEYIIRDGENYYKVRDDYIGRLSAHEIVVTAFDSETGIITLKNSWGSDRAVETYNINDLFIGSISYFSLQSLGSGIKKRKKQTKRKNKYKIRSKNKKTLKTGK
jgi:hypothetical protein